MTEKFHYDKLKRISTVKFYTSDISHHNIKNVFLTCDITIYEDLNFIN